MNGSAWRSSTRCASSGPSSYQLCRGRSPGGEFDGVAARRRATARAAVLPARRGSPALRRFAPSGRSLAVGIGLLLLAGGAYAAALETSVFAVRRLEIV